VVRFHFSLASKVITTDILIFHQSGFTYKFMTFWQSMVIAILANSTNMAGGKSDEHSDPELWGRQSQNFLICLEMLLFSIAHFYCFPTDEWEAGYRPTKEKRMSAGDNLALGDFVNDLRLMLRGSDIALDNKRRSKKMSTKKKVDDDVDLLSTVYEDLKAEDEIDVNREEGVSDAEHQNDSLDHEGVIFDQQGDDVDLTIRSGDLKRQKRTLEKRLFSFRRKK